MYNYDFKNKNVIIELIEVLVSFGNKELTLNLIVTNDELLLFKNVKANTILSGRGIYEMPEYELVLSINLNEINYIVDEQNTVIKIKEKEVIIYNFDLSKVKKP